ncbi:hypothetical protein L873DRAFT_1799834 [Choiromyces venosus 120613-1]|uniref:Uncharacterized protein n=1 Tax=Choiromyces venosus 120613-1 TaxID=1336337 RepID=A0A3N4K1A0_9PEZI|nr:hypothetical protein L873DRAFT_1799834 [Choiromyces venosus 120613-1]
MVYDIATNKEMKAHIERTVTASEQRTEDKLENLKLSTKSELENLRLSMERTEDKLENLMLSTKSKLDNLRLSMELAIRK